VIATPTSIPGVMVLDLTPAVDARGFFARAFSVTEMSALGLEGSIRQTGISWNAHAGTVRGMHYQDGPDGEAKFVRCTAGRAFDVVIDLRRRSPSYGRWMSVELSAANRRELFIPPGCAHGFQTLDDDTEVYYLLSQEFRPERDRGVRWNDPAFGITWPLACHVISPRDAAFPDHVL
jgi:dTDP-4-dehydrorhamnose 3,5-epimerase